MKRGEAEAALDRIRAFCLGRSQVLPAQILDLMDPAGRWTVEGAMTRTAAQAGPDPRADPITGCLPVTASGQ